MAADFAALARIGGLTGRPIWSQGQAREVFIRPIPQSETGEVFIAPIPTQWQREIDRLETALVTEQRHA